MQRTVSVLLTSFLAGLVLTGCPEKKVEKEEPVAPSAASDKSGADKSAADKNGPDEKAVEDEHGDEADDRAEAPGDDKRPKRHRVDKKPAAGADKDQGGW
jgi:hypothetical protein